MIVLFSGLLRSTHNDIQEHCHYVEQRDKAIHNKGILVIARNRMTKQSKKGYIYILSNFKNGTLYTGVTSNLIKRTYQHKNKLIEGFSKKYDLTQLVYYEIFDSIGDAIVRDKQMKGGSRKKKLQLINNFNKEWKDLYDSIV